jgi:protein-S-isoprenylcysteine O-methyltransferase Ste14
VPLLNKIARTFNPNFSYLALFSTPAVRVPTTRVDGPTTITAAGPYCFSRNPIYRAFTLLYAGVTVLANARWVAVLLPGVLIVMQRGMIEREERYRERGFGDEYRRYKAHVRRWV